MRTLVIGGIEVPLKASHTLSQAYSAVQAVNRVRAVGGNLLQQVAWSGKLATTINAAGEIPAGLQALDYTAAITIQCVAERAISSASNVITLPAARRSDYAPEGRALLNGVWQSTPVAMTGDDATLTIVTGASLYQAVYWPELSCYCDPPSETRGARNADYSWTLSGEEI